MQEKILRVIEYGEIQRVGGNDTLRVDVRIVGATNADLQGLAAEGQFRKDLLDRLAFDVITVPPLRERLEDVMTAGACIRNQHGQRTETGFFPGLQSSCRLSAAAAQVAR